MELECNSDSSTQTEDESGPDSGTESDEDDVDKPEQFEPERDAPTISISKTVIEQSKAKILKEKLAKLYMDIKAQAQIPTAPGYNKLACTYPPRPFAVQPLPSTVQEPVHYFELFWTVDIWNTLVTNTNSYAQFKNARCKGNNLEKKSR